MSSEFAGAAVTGLGAVTGFGNGVDRFWNGLCSGDTCVQEFGASGHSGDPGHSGEPRDRRLFDPTSHRTRIAAVVEVEPHPWLSRADRFAIAATEEAVSQAFGTTSAIPRDAGVFFGSSTGALLETENVFERMMNGLLPLPLRQIGSQQHNGPGDAAARMLGVSGPVLTLSSACASSTMAIGAAMDALRTGEVDVAIAGGSDELSRLTYAGFNSLRAVAAEPTRPFRADRRGLSLGEGAGVLVLETIDRAKRRGANILAFVSGVASSCDAHHMSAPLGDGSGAARAMRLAIEDAGLGPDDIDFLNVHGTGTRQNDVAEWQAIVDVFRTRCSGVPVTATKGAIGHLLGASGAIEAVATALSLVHDRVPPTTGDGPVDPEIPARLVLGDALPLEGAFAGLSTNLAFGGANSAVVLTSTRGPRP